LEYYHKYRPNRKYGGGCIMPEETKEDFMGEIKKKTIEQFNKAIETLEKDLPQEEIDRRNWKFAGVKFIKSEANEE
jgi:hypothetical protein